MAIYFPSSAINDGGLPSWLSHTNAYDQDESTAATALQGTFLGDSGYRYRSMRHIGFPSVSAAGPRNIVFMVRIVGAGTGNYVNNQIAELQVNWTADLVTLPGPYVGPNYKQIDTWLFQANHDSGILRSSWPLASSVDTTKLWAQSNFIKYNESTSGLYLLTCYVYEVFIETPESGGGSSSIFASMF